MSSGEVADSTEWLLPLKTTENATGDAEVKYGGSLLIPRSARCVGSTSAVIGTFEEECKLYEEVGLY